MNNTRIDSATVRKIAVLASADPRTVVRRLRGLPVRGMAAHRVDETLRRMGHTPEAPADSCSCGRLLRVGDHITCEACAVARTK